MKYHDYEWELHKDRIILDRDLNIDKLGWKHGDCFKVTNVNGQPMLIKMEELEKFVRGHK
jgi:hypothetical protein